MRRSFAAAALTGLLAGFFVAALSTSSFAAKPMSEKSLLKLIELGTDDTTIVSSIGRNGVDFVANDETLKRLKEGVHRRRFFKRCKRLPGRPPVSGPQRPWHSRT